MRARRDHRRCGRDRNRACFDNATASRDGLCSAASCRTAASGDGLCSATSCRSAASRDALCVSAGDAGGVVSAAATGFLLNAENLIPKNQAVRMAGIRPAIRPEAF